MLCYLSSLARRLSRNGNREKEPKPTLYCNCNCCGESPIIGDNILYDRTRAEIYRLTCEGMIRNHRGWGSRKPLPPFEHISRKDAEKLLKRGELIQSPRRS